MLFAKFGFWGFFAIVGALYVVLPHRWQNRMLLVVSYVFHAAWDWRFLSLILLDVAWIPDIVAASAAEFAAESTTPHPAVRSYGMSFVDRIMAQSEALRPNIPFDRHGGPAAPANFALDLFESDRANRNPGDVVVLGILSSSLPAMRAMTNATWLFEQPAPFTYAIFRPYGAVAVPRIGSLDAYLASGSDPAAAARWREQLACEDAFYGWQTFGAPWLDASPFARLVRRTAAARHIASVERFIVAGDAFPVAETLLAIIDRFERMARQDRQHPVVTPIQSRDRGDLDLVATLASALADRGIPYLATADVIDTTSLRTFLPDGHDTEAHDRDLAAAFVKMLPF